MDENIWVLWGGRVMDEGILERNRNLNRGFRKLLVWREAIDLYVFIKHILNGLNG